MDHVFDILYKGQSRGVMISVIVSSPYSHHTSMEERREFLEVITKVVRGTLPAIEAKVKEDIAP